MLSQSKLVTTNQKGKNNKIEWSYNCIQREEIYLTTVTLIVHQCKIYLISRICIVLLHYDCVIIKILIRLSMPGPQLRYSNELHSLTCRIYNCHDCSGNTVIRACLNVS